MLHKWPAQHCSHHFDVFFVLTVKVDNGKTPPSFPTLMLFCTKNWGRHIRITSLLKSCTWILKDKNEALSVCVPCLSFLLPQWWLNLSLLADLSMFASTPFYVWHSVIDGKAIIPNSSHYFGNCFGIWVQLILVKNTVFGVIVWVTHWHSIAHRKGWLI